DRSCHRQLFLCVAPGNLIGVYEIGEIARRGAVHARENVGHHGGNGEERQHAGEERRGGGFVCGVVGGGERAAPLPRLAREREHRERLEVRRPALEGEKRQVGPLPRGRCARWVRERG